MTPGVDPDPIDAAITPERLAAHPVVVYDESCVLCSHAVQFVIRHDSDRRFRFAAARSEAGQRLQARFRIDALAHRTIILVTGDRSYERSDAAVAIARRLDPPWHLLALLRIVPRPLRDWGYGVIARYRYRWFGRRECGEPAPREADRFL